MSPLNISLSVEFVDVGPEGLVPSLLEMAGRARKAEKAYSANTFVRMEGVSASGPCAECMQWFGVYHDGSGKEVPMEPLHDLCVCWNAPLGDIELLGLADEFPPQEQFEYLKDLSPSELTATVGKARAALIGEGAMKIGPQLFEDMSGDSSLRPLARTPIKATGAAAQRLGISRSQFSKLGPIQKKRAIINAARLSPPA